MTKREYLKYNREVYDKYDNLIKPGDTVVFPDGYYNDCHVGKVSHFTENNVIIIYKVAEYNGTCKAQRHPSRIVKINGDPSHFKFKK